MYKLTDLIKWNMAEARIYLETGVNIQDLEEQLLLRGEFDEFQALKNLRMPELIKVANSWPGPRTRYCVEDIIADIETRKPKRKMVITVGKSRSYVNRNEAEMAIFEEKDGNWVQVPSEMPGFLVANNKTELTLDNEIKRTVKYLGKKYLPDLYEKEFVQHSYEFTSFKISNAKKIKGKNIAEIEVSMQKNPAGVYKNIHEYWEKELAPMLLEDKTAPANKKLALIGFLRDISNNYKGVGDINLKKVQNTIHALNDMLSKAIEEPEKYRIKKKVSHIEIDRAKKIYANGLVEAVVTNPCIIEAIYDHEIASKFHNREPFKAKVEAEIEYC